MYTTGSWPKQGGT